VELTLIRDNNIPTNVFARHVEYLCVICKCACPVCGFNQC
jgi:hypothetical protein